MARTLVIGNETSKNQILSYLSALADNSSQLSAISGCLWFVYERIKESLHKDKFLVLFFSPKTSFID